MTRLRHLLRAITARRRRRATVQRQAAAIADRYDAHGLTLITERTVDDLTDAETLDRLDRELDCNGDLRAIRQHMEQQARRIGRQGGAA